MLEDAAGIRRVVLACGTVDLRKGIDGLATIVGDKYGQNPFETTRWQRDTAGALCFCKWFFHPHNGIHTHAAACGSP